MGADAALLAEVADGAPPVLRLYRWSPPALSLGHFQPDDDIDAAACALGVEVVRRPTGGGASTAATTCTVAMPRPGAEAASTVYRRLAGG